MFKADGSITITGKKMAVKTVDRTFLQGQQSVLIYFALQSKVKQLATHMNEGLGLLSRLRISDKIFPSTLEKNNYLLVIAFLQLSKDLVQSG